jgi:hypothetical protein
MKRGWLAVALAAIVALTLTTPALADVTIKSTTSVSGGPMPMETSSVVTVKGQRARVDLTMMGQDRSIIFDLATRKVTLLDHAAKTAQVMDVPGFLQMTDQMAGGITVEKAELTPTGQKKDIDGVSCEEYRFVMVGRMSPMGQTVTMNVTGTQWLAKGGPGLAEVLAFSAAARQAGIPSIMGLGGSGGIPIPQKDLARLVEANGVPYVADMQMAMTGEGDAAAVLSQMGSMKAHTAVSSVSTEPVADGRFAVPAGYAAK